jgi:uncharacterized protein YqgV (UPF0045/DUF77 family)
MQLSVEISMYPLNSEYIAPITAFIERLKSYDDIEVIGNTMSTQLFGDYQRVMSILSEEMQTVHEQDDTVIFATKFINGNLSPNQA